jgi:hypothetical protein
MHVMPIAMHLQFILQYTFTRKFVAPGLTMGGKTLRATTNVWIIEPQGMNIDGKVHPTDFFESRRASDLSVQSQDTWAPRWLSSVGPWSLVE